MKLIYFFVVSIFVLQFVFASTNVPFGVGVDVIPSELFDIYLEIQDSSVAYGSDLAFSVSFESFGTDAVPTNVSYFILDSSGSQVYFEEEHFVVYSERFYFKEVPVNFSKGEYKLGMNVSYSGIVEEFSDSFVVRNGFFQKFGNFFRKIFS